MKKIISLFKRNYDGDRLVRNEVVPGAEWVLNGEGIPTEKLDGTCCMLRDGKLYKRHELKKGSKPPQDFEPANEVDAVTGKQQGWLPVGDGPEDQYHREGLENQKHLVDGTYELMGPKIQGNSKGLVIHCLFRHDSIPALPECKRDFESIKEYLKDLNIEGIVWHHPDGRMVKIKRKDFFKQKR